MNISDIYDSIGYAGVSLIIIAIAGIYIALKNFIYMHLIWRGFQKDFLNMECQDTHCITNVCENSTNPLISILRDIVQTHAAHSEDIRAEVAYLFHRNFEHIQKGLYWLRLISVISPLLGLLGTVLGMVKVFQTISMNASPNTTLLAMGIWEALITTIMGLTIAIPILVFYYYLVMKFKGFHIEAIEHSYRALELYNGVKRGSYRATYTMQKRV